jgi:hypothetical protein
MVEAETGTERRQPTAPHRALMRHAAEFRFYEELNDFLPPARRKQSFTHGFDGTPAVKDTIESLGVPHTEVDLILVPCAAPASSRMCISA